MCHRVKEEEEEKREPETFFDLDPIKQQHESVCVLWDDGRVEMKRHAETSRYIYTIM